MKKYKLPDDNNLIITENVLNIFKKYKQTKSKPESGGFLLGYVDKKTNSIIIDNLTTPQELDEQGRFYFHIIDPVHLEIMEEFEKKHSYFAGTWHTHPSKKSNYSLKDLIDWKLSLKKERPTGNYYIFVIIGLNEVGVWVGDVKSKKIKRVEEVVNNVK